MIRLRECPLCASNDVVLVIGAVEFTDAEVQCKACGACSGNHDGGTAEENEAADLAAIVALPDVAKRRDWLKANRASASTMLETAIEAAQARMTPPDWDNADPGVAA